MKNLSRPPVDTELFQEHVESFGAALTRRLEIAKTHASALSTLVSTARTLAGSVALVEPQSDELCHALRIGARAAAALFQVATGNGIVEVDLGEMRTKLPATGPTDATHAGNWRVGWWFSHILRDRPTIESLTATPVDVLRRSSTRGDECQYLFVEALQAFEKRAADFSAKLRAAIDATDPEKIALVDEEFVLNILVPEMQMLLRLAVGEVQPFNEALRFSLERHAKYWSKGKRKQDPDGFLALGPLALAGMAHDAGMHIEIDSDYLPKRLVDGQCRA